MILPANIITLGILGQTTPELFISDLPNKAIQETHTIAVSAGTLKFINIFKKVPPEISTENMLFTANISKISIKKVRKPTSESTDKSTQKVIVSKLYFKMLPKAIVKSYTENENSTQSILIPSIKLHSHNIVRGYINNSDDSEILIRIPSIKLRKK